MRSTKILLWLLSGLSAVLLSLPWLVPHAGALSLFAFVPLLIADAVIEQTKVRASWIYPAATFLAWNAATTFWVCNATVGGGIFAIVANAAQMLLIWLLFRLAKKKLGGVVPYIFLAVMWIAWERHYFDVDMSWPWLTLGGAFAQSTPLVQWYEYTGTLGGSLWIWMTNLSVFGCIVALSDAYWRRWNVLARLCTVLGVIALFAGPLVGSRLLYDRYDERTEGSLDVIIAQPNIDPYQKFQSMSQAEQTSRLLGLFGRVLDQRPAASSLLLAPETFTSDLILNHPDESPTLQRFREFLGKYPGAELLFGASSYEISGGNVAPTILARPYGQDWIVSHNSAVLTRAQGPIELHHKSKLVIGTEMTPYPKIFVPLDNWLSKKLGVSGLMGRCVGADRVSLLHVGPARIPVGCAVCYESIYGEYCTEYVKAGARAMTIITNDAWWGNTPGYRQHLNFARLRAIELRRDIARCGNTGISCFIDQRGDILCQTDWWTQETLAAPLRLNTYETAFVRYGDLTGRVCTLVFLLLAAFLLVRLFVPGRR
ncbi:MAG: apolipoprotein N-acyltransferase [Bacteroidales bacterium]|nr:apolipoprotein N-acyltransferase [Bacteroidales bacterium]